MAIKVIKTEPAQSVIIRKVCRNCGVTLEFVPADVQHRTWKEIDMSSGGCKYVVCPHCKDEVTWDQY
jgi:hypothetical protein